MASGHGVGKSTLVSWIVLWAMSTTQMHEASSPPIPSKLKTKTWVKLAKWYRLFVGRPLFRLEATALFSVDPRSCRRPGAPTWFRGLSAIPRHSLVYTTGPSGVYDIRLAGLKYPNHHLGNS